MQAREAEELLADVPDYFVCPITRQVMEFPFLTTAGNCYEYHAIQTWLSRNSTDPKTGARLSSKDLIPNHGLRSHILSWFEENPSYEILRNKDAIRPPAEAYQIKQNGLDQILVYRGKTDEPSPKKKEKAAVRPGDDKVTLPESFTAFGHSYTFSFGKSENGSAATTTLISCDHGEPIEMPDRCVFATSCGLMFYDPKEMRDTRVLPGTDYTDPCKFSNNCNRDDCAYAHPFVCLQGVSCPRQRNGCKFFHPTADSITRNQAQVCKYSTSCTRQDCWFGHPNGRMAVQRVRARILVTHSHTLELLPNPIEFDLDLPDAATSFQVQGEFVLSFQPFPGSWAKHHFKVVTVHRFVPQIRQGGAYKSIGDYSLKGHYCNCAVAAGRYLIFSFWPYEEEAMRTIWGCLRVTRALEKELKTKTKECEDLRQQLDGKKEEVQNLNLVIDTKNLQLQKAERQVQVARKQLREARQENREIRQDLYHARQDLRAEKQKNYENRQKVKQARKEAADARREARESESRWRQMYQRQERERTERLRLRDPILIYALQGGTSGMHSDDWKLVLDYHKGAHAIEIGSPRPDGKQLVQFTVHDSTFQFDLVVPQNVSSLKAQLPFQPPVLCPDF